MQLVECVPNISEGRDKDIVEQVVRAVRETPGVTLLDIELDAAHNRSVISFIGAPEAALEAALRLARRAVELIDLNAHSGEHPRMGAVDVIPFIPIREMDMAQCVDLATRLGRRVYDELGVPVFLYEQAATSPGRRNLADIRRGEFEGMSEKLLREEWAPDFGGRSIHPTAGVVAVGARMPLVAFNINLNTDRLPVAKAIAKIIRQSGGGLGEVKALGMMVEDWHTAQVSINMTDYTKTPLYRVLELVKLEAARYGVTVAGCEIVGLTPMNALIDTAAYYLQLQGFNRDHQVLENHLR